MFLKLLVLGGFFLLAALIYTNHFGLANKLVNYFYFIFLGVILLIGLNYEAE